MDAQLEDLRQKQIEEQKQRVIPKPKIDNAQPLNEVVKKPVSSEKSIIDENLNHDYPIIIGGEDKSDADARKKRDKVKAVSENPIKICSKPFGK